MTVAIVVNHRHHLLKRLAAVGPPDPPTPVVGFTDEFTADVDPLGAPWVLIGADFKQAYSSLMPKAYSGTRDYPLALRDAETDLVDINTEAYINHGLPYSGIAYAQPQAGPTTGSPRLGTVAWGGGVLKLYGHDGTVQTFPGVLPGNNNYFVMRVKVTGEPGAYAVQAWVGGVDMGTLTDAVAALPGTYVGAIYQRTYEDQYALRSVAAYSPS